MSYFWRNVNIPWLRYVFIISFFQINGNWIKKTILPLCSFSSVRHCIWLYNNCLFYSYCGLYELLSWVIYIFLFIIMMVYAVVHVHTLCYFIESCILWINYWLFLRQPGVFVHLWFVLCTGNQYCGRCNMLALPGVRK